MNFSLISTMFFSLNSKIITTKLKKNCKSIKITVCYYNRKKKGKLRKL